MKTYILIFLDKQNNELLRKLTTAENIKEARKRAKNILALSMINDLHKIKVTLQ